MASPGAWERLAVLNWRSSSIHPSSYYLNLQSHPAIEIIILIRCMEWILIYFSATVKSTWLGWGLRLQCFVTCPAARNISTSCPACSAPPPVNGDLNSHPERPGEIIDLGTGKNCQTWHGQSSCQFWHLCDFSLSSYGQTFRFSAPTLLVGRPEEQSGP